MMNCTLWKENCYNYFMTNSIKDEKQLSDCLREKPLSKDGLTDGVITAIFSNYLREAKVTEERELIKRDATQKYTIACISDLHIPYHDEKSVKTAFEFLVKNKPNEIILLGDIIDCYQGSKFTKKPKNNMYIQDECDMFYEIFKPLVEALPKTKFVYILGNHEDRVNKQAMEHPAFYGIRGLEIPKLLRLDELNIEYYNEIYEVKDISFIHGEAVRGNASYSAKAEFDSHLCNGVSGHTHRLGSYHKTVKHDLVRVWLENGCLCDLYPEYMRNPNWQQGFTYIECIKGEKFFHPIEIKNHMISYGDTIYGEK